LASEIVREKAIEARPSHASALVMRRLFRKKTAAALVHRRSYFCGLCAPVVAPQSYTKQDLSHVREGPSLSHPLGTDPLGRDMLSRVIWASRTTVIVTVATLVTGGLVLSVSLGLLAGYLGGLVDTIIMRVGDVFIALPGLPMLILVNATLKEKLVDRPWVETLQVWLRVDGLADYIVIFGALSLFAWVGGARVIRSQILALRETDYVVAARAMGASVWRVIFRHLLPNVATSSSSACQPVSAASPAPRSPSPGSAWASSRRLRASARCSLRVGPFVPFKPALTCCWCRGLWWRASSSPSTSWVTPSPTS
jgi:ABC-type dipeptide/oligopeptide/nickel transport system permease subunit